MSIIFSFIVLLKTLNNFIIEVHEFGFGLDEYLDDYWNYIEVSAICCTFIYGLIDLLLIWKVMAFNNTL